MKDMCLHDFQTDSKLEKVLHNLLLWYQDLSIREEVLQQQPILNECTNSEDCQGQNESDGEVDDSEMYYTGIAETLKELLIVIKKSNVKNEL